MDEDSSKSRILRLLEFLKKYSKYYIYQEGGGDTGKKLHYHIAIEVAEMKEYNAIKTRWTTTFKDIPQTERSCAQDKTGNYHVYITKDKNRIKSEGVTDEELDQIEEQSYVSDTKIENKSTRKNFTKYLLDEFAKDHEGVIIPEENYRSAQRYMCEWLLRKWEMSDECARPFKVNMVVDIINTIMIKNAGKFLFDMNQSYKLKMVEALLNAF